MTPDPSEVCSSLTTILAGRPLPIIRRTAAQVMALLSNPNSKVDTIADAMLKAMEFGSQVDLDRGCFALDGTTSPLTMRHSSIGLCIERVERNFGVGSGFH